MSDIVRVSFTVQEAAGLIEELSYHDEFCPAHCRVASAVDKIRKASANPLNGPTFDFGQKQEADHG